MPTFQEVLSGQTEQIAERTQKLHETASQGEMDEVVQQSDEIGTMLDELAQRVTQARKVLEGEDE